MRTTQALQVSSSKVARKKNLWHCKAQNRLYSDELLESNFYIDDSDSRDNDQSEHAYDLSPEFAEDKAETSADAVAAPSNESTDMPAISSGNPPSVKQELASRLKKRIEERDGLLLL
jgi:hypothetical protein